MEQNPQLLAAYQKMAELLRQAEQTRLADTAKLPQDTFSHSLRQYLGERLIEAGEWLTSGTPQPADDRM